MWNLSRVNGNKFDTDEILNVVENSFDKAPNSQAPSLKEANSQAHKSSGWNQKRIEGGWQSRITMDNGGQWTTNDKDEFKKQLAAVREHERAHLIANAEEFKASTAGLDDQVRENVREMAYDPKDIKDSDSELHHKLQAHQPAYKKPLFFVRDFFNQNVLSKFKINDQ